MGLRRKTGGWKASGTAISDATVSSGYTHLSGTGAPNKYSITVPPLGFVPNKIVIVPADGEQLSYVTIYTKDRMFTAPYQTEQIQNFKPGAETISGGYGFRANYGTPYVNESGFKLPVQSGNKTYKWFAYED